jgi:hypothetical protein
VGDTDSEEILKQLDSLRNEVGQLREIVRMLLEIVMEHDGDDEDVLPPGIIPYMDGGRITGEDFRDLGM